MALAAAAAAIVPAPASAGVDQVPETLNFNSRQAGTTSDFKSVDVHVTCDAMILGNCAQAGTLTPGPVFSGANPGDFSQTNDCGAGVTSDTFDFCTFLVSFTPTAAGSRAATLTLGTGSEFPDPTPTPRTVALTGTATPEPAITPTLPTTLTPSTTAAKRKCKKGKKRSAATAKKGCSKKKKKKK
jgi:hypothetical protein